MSTRIVAALALAGLLVAQGVNHAQDDNKKKERKFTAKCPVSGKDALQEQSAAYLKGKVYFCCPNCPKAFKDNTEKFATKANHQLVQTRQYRATKCALTGRDLNPEMAVKIAGVKTTFCCNNCKTKIEAAEGDEQLALVFSEKPFKTGFEFRQPKKKKKSAE